MRRLFNQTWNLFFRFDYAICSTNLTFVILGNSHVKTVSKNELCLLINAWIAKWLPTWLWTLVCCALGCEVMPRSQDFFFGSNITSTSDRQTDRQEQKGNIIKEYFYLLMICKNCIWKFVQNWSNFLKKTTRYNVSKSSFTWPFVFRFSNRCFFAAGFFQFSKIMSTASEAFKKLDLKVWTSKKSNFVIVKLSMVKFTFCSLI